MCTQNCLKLTFAEDLLYRVGLNYVWAEGHFDKIYAAKGVMN